MIDRTYTKAELNTLPFDKLPASAWLKLSAKRRAELEPERQALKAKWKSWLAELEKNESAGRAELAGDGDDDNYRYILELATETGLTVNEVWNLPNHELERYRRAILRKRASAGKRWVLIELADCKQTRSTIRNHAIDESKPYIRKGKHGYEVLESHLHLYIKPEELRRYQPTGK